MKICAIIPVRAGSKRVPEKNIRAFAGKSLLEIKIEQLRSIPHLDEVCVNSDCPEILSVAERAGAIPYQRAARLASDFIPMSDVYAGIAEPLDCDNILYATVTTPFIESTVYREAIDLYINRKKLFDSVHSVQRVNDFLIDPEGNPLNYNPAAFPRSQDLPNYRRLIFGFSILPRETMIRKRSSLGYRPLFIEMTQVQAIDIDSEVDFAIAEFLYQSLPAFAFPKRG